MTALMTDDRETSVLVVEDEPLIRMTAVDMLEDAGFAVQEASNAHEAIERLRRDPDLHVLFTDVTMPGSMDGLALAHHAARDYPRIGVVIVSSHPAPAPHLMPEGALFLAKPYEPHHAVAHVHRVTRPL